MLNIQEENKGLKSMRRMPIGFPIDTVFLFVRSFYCIYNWGDIPSSTAAKQSAISEGAISVSNSATKTKVLMVVFYSRISRGS